MMRRIADHPVLGTAPPAPEITVFVDGEPVKGKLGEPLAALLIAAGIKVFRRTVKGAPRALFCGIGQCTDCAMTVNGVPNVRTCVTPASDGMVIETRKGTGIGGIDMSNLQGDL
jgi:aerobic-type carbon monoxide dehydrogenase small subunit (CoxS/CutS family)